MQRRLLRRSEPIQQKRANMDTPTASSADLFPAELVHLLGTATRTIDQHVNNGGKCADCGSIWPCQLAQLAEFALAAL